MNSNNILVLYTTLYISAIDAFNVGIVGAGPAGALASIALAKKGHDVNIFEPLPVSRVDKNKAYNLVLTKRGTDALDRFGIIYKDKCVEITNIVTHQNGVVSEHKMTDRVSISRNDLVNSILDVAKISGVKVHSAKLITVDTNDNLAFFDSGNYEYDLLVGCDGSRSKTRSVIRSSNLDFDYTEHIDHRAFHTFDISNDELKDMNDYNEIWDSSFHVWKDLIGESELICPPTVEGGLTVSYVSKGEFNISDFPDIKLGRHYVEHLESKKPRYTNTVYCTHAGLGNILLMGDALHAMFPSLGQGVNVALEDVVYLDACCKPHKKVEDIVESYNRLRLDDSHAACELSEIGFGNSDRSNRGGMHRAMMYLGNSDISYSEILKIINEDD